RRDVVRDAPAPTKSPVRKRAEVTRRGGAVVAGDAIGLAAVDERQRAVRAPARAAQRAVADPQLAGPLIATAGDVAVRGVDHPAAELDAEAEEVAIADVGAEPVRRDRIRAEPQVIEHERAALDNLDLDDDLATRRALVH